MSIDFDDEFGEDPWEEAENEMSCDFGVSEFCEDPWAKSMGLCTTECGAYLRACQEANKNK